MVEGKVFQATRNPAVQLKNGPNLEEAIEHEETESVRLPLNV
jgi:hypothetical protein